MTATNPGVFGHAIIDLTVALEAVKAVM